MSTEEEFQKQFQRSADVISIRKYGISTAQDLIEAQKIENHIEWLKKIGLSDQEIQLYQQNENGLTCENKKIAKEVLDDKLKMIYDKIKQHSSISSLDADLTIKFTKGEKESLYIPGHPMNNIHELEQEMFCHLKHDMLSLTKRRKILRRLERKKERILSQNYLGNPSPKNSETRPGSLWDVKEMPKESTEESKRTSKVLGPHKRTMYTVKDNKIVRLEPVPSTSTNEEYRSVDIVLPINVFEERLLEGTKMNIDDIKKIERFQNYNPGEPSKILYLKNIAASVSKDQLELLFNQFVAANGGPVSVKLMNGRMRGQAFVTFQDVNTAINALEEINGTILSGKPIVAQFGKNRIQNDT